MKTTRLLALVAAVIVTSAGALHAEPQPPVEEGGKVDPAILRAMLEQLQKVLAEPTAESDATPVEPAPAPQAAPVVSKPVAPPAVTSLQMSRLDGRSLQPSTGLSGATRGLTPRDDWRAMFPKSRAAQ